MLTELDCRTLASAFLFQEYRPEDLPALLDTVPWEKRAFSRGSEIFSPEHFVKELAVLLTGRVRVTKGDLVVSELRPGDLFGAAALFNDEETYVSTLTARTRCEALFLSQGAVQELLDREEPVRRCYIRYLSCRIRFLSGKIDALVQGSVEKKLSSYLLGHMDGEGRVYRECSMTELALRLNMGRASLYRDLGKLEDRGILSRDGKEIVIRRPELLATL